MIRTLSIAATAAALALSAPAAQAQKTKVQWLGQATFKITSPGGRVIVIDPFLRRNPKTPAAYKDLKKLGKVDLILVTHGHGDHFSDAPALAKLTGANERWLINRRGRPIDGEAFRQRLGVTSELLSISNNRFEGTGLPSQLGLMTKLTENGAA